MEYHGDYDSSVSSTRCVQAGYLPRKSQSPGFDTDDIAALVSAIDGIQHMSQEDVHPLPQLPAELIFCILERVPVDYMYTWRSVCRGFRDAIDKGSVLLRLLRRTELIAYLGPSEEFPGYMSARRKDRFTFLRADYERIEQSATNEAKSANTGSSPTSANAVFQIRDEWLQDYAVLRQRCTEDNSWATFRLDKLIERVCGPRPDDQFRTDLKWCIQLDKGVQDIEHRGSNSSGDIQVDLINRQVTVQWKPLLLRFLKSEMLLRIVKKMVGVCELTLRHLR
jgi:hypothetical protein